MLEVVSAPACVEYGEPWPPSLPIIGDDRINNWGQAGREDGPFYSLPSFLSSSAAETSAAKLRSGVLARTCWSV